MKQVKGIEMANSSDLYEVTYSGVIEIKPNSDGGAGFDILIAGEEVDYCRTMEEAKETAETYIVDDDLIIAGYGMYAGRKFWQLSQELQNEVINLALK